MENIKANLLSGKYENVFISTRGKDCTKGSLPFKTVLLGERKAVKVWYEIGDITDDSDLYCLYREVAGYIFVAQYQPLLDLTLMGYVEF